MNAPSGDTQKTCLWLLSRIVPLPARIGAVCSELGVIHQRFLHPSRAERCPCPLATDPFYRSGTLEGAHPLITILASIQLFYTLYCDNKLIRSVS